MLKTNAAIHVADLAAGRALHPENATRKSSRPLNSAVSEHFWPFRC